MSILKELIGQVLDEKYRIEKQLGQGGMGAVYMATHVGTLRPVALKVIAPQFMTHPEFVERFRREAEAAGRLRHPNVVDVTDFGFAQIGQERLAYLVMEYLDGCTLGDVLKEEKKLPLSWVVEIVEQVCLAIDKAHNQGIIHRDLKPDNIWLEPNERGGYTVKVLDFGLAKLADSALSRPKAEPVATKAAPISEVDSHLLSMATVAQPSLEFAEAATHVQTATIPDEEKTAVQPPSVRQTDAQNSNAQTAPSAGLTQAGAILGTPLYMSPEQCLGKTLDARSDIYSMGLIAYEMLAGETPFTGGMTAIMAQHISTAPPPLKEKRGDIPVAVANLIMSALEKEPDNRPASAAAFASAIRARAEGPNAIVRQAFALYSENFSTFFRISVLAYLPSLFLHVVSISHTVVEHVSPKNPIMGLLLTLIFIGAVVGTMFSQTINAGFFVPVVAQLLIAPLRALELRPAYEALKKRLRVFIPGSLVYSIGQFLMVMSFATFAVFLGFTTQRILKNPMGYINSPAKLIYIGVIALIMGAICFALVKGTFNYILYAPVAIMEGLGGRALYRRSKQLSYRSRKAVRFILYIYLGTFIGYSISSAIFKVFVLKAIENVILVTVATLVYHVVGALFFLLINPLLAVSLALLYFKTRQHDGEQLKNVLSQYERETLPAHNWQLRMRNQPLSILKSMKSNNSI